MPEARPHVVVMLLTGLMRRQFLFAALVFAAFLGFITLAGQWSWAMVAIAVVAALMLGLFAALVWFWIHVFSHMGRREQ